MGKFPWDRVLPACITGIYLLVVGAMLAGAYDAGVADLYAWLARPAPPVFTHWIVKTVIAISLTVAWLTFFWPDIKPWLRFGGKGRDDETEPVHTLSLYEIIRIVGAARTKGGRGSSSDIIVAIYDRLRDGSLKAWGRRTRGFPEKPEMPWPKRQLVPASFWEDNAIEELDYWLEKAHFMHHDPTRTVTRPTRGIRSFAPHYWDLAFKATDAYDCWPSPQSWMRI